MATRRGGDDEDEDEFVAFWAQHGKPSETKRILGVDVVVPTDVPLSFEDRLDELQESNSREDLETLLEILFGEGTITQWKANGCTTAQYRLLLAWGMLNAQHGPTSFEQAAERVANAEKAAAEGKAPAPNRATRRAAASSKTAASDRAGRTSSRISAANTRSRPKS